MQWYGGQEFFNVTTVASQTEANLVKIRPSHLSLDAMREYRVERLIAYFSYHRIDTTGIDLLNYAFYMADTDSSGIVTDILQIQDNDPFVFANKSLINWGCLCVPETTTYWDGEAAVRVVTKGGMCHHVDFKPRRRIDLAREAIILQVNADISSQVQMTVQWRLLLSS